MSQISNMLLFIIKETFISIRKAKGSFLISLITASMAIFLITSSLFLYDLSGSVQKKLRSSIVLNVFINESLSEEEISLVKEEVAKAEFIHKSDYISKTDAAELFRKETGEDFSKILDYNPLPASFRITLKEDYVNPESLKAAVKHLSSVEGVDEVVYQDQIAEKIFSIVEESKKYVSGAAVILILISIYIIYSTSRLILKARADEMETMKLIGARISVIKMPVILNSVITGFAAGIFSLIIFSLFVNSIEDYIWQQFSYRLNYIFLLGVTIFTGPVLGVIISHITLRKITLKV
jgi:cell division transport system permease protein